MGDFAKALAQFYTKGYFGKKVKMSLPLAITLLDMAEKMKDEVPETDHERYCQAIQWIEQQACSRYSQAQRAQWRLTSKPKSIQQP